LEWLVLGGLTGGRKRGKCATVEAAERADHDMATATADFSAVSFASAPELQKNTWPRSPVASNSSSLT
jgi:hypothetical protein